MNANECLICDDGCNCPGPTIRNLPDAIAHFGAVGTFPFLLGELRESHGTPDTHVAVQVRETPIPDACGQMQYLVGYRVIRPTEDFADERLEWHNVLTCADGVVAGRLATIVQSAYIGQYNRDRSKATEALMKGNVYEVVTIGHNRPFPDEGAELPFVTACWTKAKGLLEEYITEIGDEWS